MQSCKRSAATRGTVIDSNEVGNTCLFRIASEKREIATDLQRTTQHKIPGKDRAGEEREVRAERRERELEGGEEGGERREERREGRRDTREEHGEER